MGDPKLTEAALRLAGAAKPLQTDEIAPRAGKSDNYVKSTGQPAARAGSDAG